MRLDEAIEKAKEAKEKELAEKEKRKEERLWTCVYKTVRSKLIATTMNFVATAEYELFLQLTVAGKSTEKCFHDYIVPA